MNVTTIDTPDGTIKIDAKLFQNYNVEALDVLEKISELTKDFKELVGTVAETTGMKKPKVSRYFKARFAEKTKDASSLGVLFETLDGIIS